MHKNLRVAQIGVGYWGPNLLRNLFDISQIEVSSVVEISEERRNFVKKKFSGNYQLETNPEKIISNPNIDAIIIATPANTHFDLVTDCLNAGKHVFVEKPVATTVKEIEKLEQLSQKTGKIVMAGHTFLYSSPVRYIKKYIDEGLLGEIRYMMSERLNLGRIRDDVNALWNLAPHDISIVSYFLDDQDPEQIHYHGMDFLQKGIDDVSFLNLSYKSKVMANIHVSWLSPQKRRLFTVVGSKKMLVYDDTSENKITIYDKGIDEIPAKLGSHMDYDRMDRVSFSYRYGDILIPNIPTWEPIRLELEHFRDCIFEEKEPLTNLKHAKNVVRILEESQNLA